jgi:hypothetical protein
MGIGLSLQAPQENTMRTFSKSKLMALRQCPKRFWLEIHRSHLREDSAATQVSFQIGHEVGGIAQSRKCRLA